MGVRVRLPSAAPVTPLDLWKIQGGLSLCGGAPLNIKLGLRAAGHTGDVTAPAVMYHSLADGQDLLPAHTLAL